MPVARLWIRMIKNEIKSVSTTHPLQEAGPDLRALGVQGDGQAWVHAVLLLPTKYKFWKKNKNDDF